MVARAPRLQVGETGATEQAREVGGAGRSSVATVRRQATWTRRSGGAACGGTTASPRTHQAHQSVRAVRFAMVVVG